MDDLISRTQAIDVLSLGKEILSRVLDDIDVVGTDREKYSWGLGLIESNIKDIEELPPAQPERCEDCENFSKTRLLIPQSEIIRCKDCKHHHYDSKDIPYCDRIDYGYGWKDDDFCSRAERRTDG